MWKSGPVDVADEDYFLALDCGGDTISIYKGTPGNVEYTLWTSPVGAMVPFHAGALEFTDFIEMNEDKHNGDCFGGPVDATFVQDQYCNERGNGCTVGWTEPGEVLSYSFRTAFPQTLTIDLRAAGPQGGKEFMAWIEGLPNSGATFTIPAGGTWMDFADYTMDVDVPAGEHVLKVEFKHGHVNLCAVSVMTK